MILTYTRLTDDKVPFFSAESRLPHELKQLLVKAANVKSVRNIRKIVYI